MKNYILVASFLFAGCVTTPPPIGTVIPRADGLYQTYANAYTRTEAMDAALYNAEGTCKKQQKRHIVLDQTIAYKGKVSESANDTIKKIGFLAGASFLTSDNDYQVQLDFKCES